MRGKHEKRPSEIREALAKKILAVGGEIFKAVIASLIAGAITRLLFRS